MLANSHNVKMEILLEPTSNKLLITYILHETSRGSKSKESKSRSSKGFKSQSKSFGKSTQAEEPVFETVDTKMPLNQGEDLGNTDDQPNIKAASKDD
ncbi:hypothetical protein Tco_0726332 [Tanacetum coccineum]|uniref:Uncharacterized protein n=1 Tax=Tanacetum coccineum TaxID=301880 RepID=A0ABQ4YGD2_9ASTR